MKISARGLRQWIHINKELGLFELYIIPTIIVSRDDTYCRNDFPTEVLLAWMFLRVYIYLKL